MASSSYSLGNRVNRAAQPCLRIGQHATMLLYIWMLHAVVVLSLMWNVQWCLTGLQDTTMAYKLAVVLALPLVFCVVFLLINVDDAEPYCW